MNRIPSIINDNRIEDGIDMCKKMANDKPLNEQFQDLLQRYIKFVNNISMKEFKGTILFDWMGDGKTLNNAESIVRVLKSKLIQKRGSMMWQIGSTTGNGSEIGVWLDIHIGEDIKRVYFLEAQNGTFASHVCTRGNRPTNYNGMFGDQCVYCRGQSVGADKIDFKKCSLCEKEMYCTKNCQTMAWVIDHRESCTRDV